MRTDSNGIGQVRLAAVMPGSVGTAVQGAQLSIGNLLLFSLSTVVLWNARPSVAPADADAGAGTLAPSAAGPSAPGR
ncbi:hypothetical protein ACIODT_22970 [Streptomyces sp. NPDC088251]|uniref:hypothetical protein n=1 Tax=unclassified Streptomyces TaxID=2593676 RepID=UPI00380718DF